MFINIMCMCVCPFLYMSINMSMHAYLCMFMYVYVYTFLYIHTCLSSLKFDLNIFSVILLFDFFAVLYQKSCIASLSKPVGSGFLQSKLHSFTSLTALIPGRTILFECILFPFFNFFYFFKDP